MEGSVLSFLKAEWKVSDTGSDHWASSLEIYIYIINSNIWFWPVNSNFHFKDCDYEIVSCNDCMGKIEIKMYSINNEDLFKLSKLIATIIIFLSIRDTVLINNPPVLGMLSLCCNFTWILWWYIKCGLSSVLEFFVLQIPPLCSQHKTSVQYRQSPVHVKPIK